jgi:spore maturation protein CgeB
VPIYNALDPDTHHPVPVREEFASALSFLGNRLPDRAERIDEFFLAAAARLPGEVFRLGGSGWADKPMPPNVIYSGHVYTRDHNAFNCAAKAVLNVNRQSMASIGASPPTRIFEAAGAGACIISDRWDGIAEFLEPGREILLADNGPVVADLVSALTPADARGIGEAARRHVLAAHTYRHRAAELEAVLEGRDRWREAG